MIALHGRLGIGGTCIWLLPESLQLLCQPAALKVGLHQFLAIQTQFLFKQIIVDLQLFQLLRALRYHPRLHRV
ncbi:MAG: hypothetical protein AUK36_05340 [Zetaproteobacteria bacterium CG2_30_59_37]|nr:MAG: hypothetical protein AUK36_05340 [Zetaproteobacteria bacterium CG2_30_59_37]